jgi:hypothetical protein
MQQGPDSMQLPEPCVACGESTVVGTTVFSGRRSLGSAGYLCELCNARLSQARGGRRLTAEELRQLVENGSMAAISWANIHI